MNDPVRHPGPSPAVATLLAGVLFLATSSQPAAQGSSDAAAVRLLQSSLDRHQSASMEYSGDLVITTRNGAERRKTWRSYRVGLGRGAHRLIVFLAPADVRGVAFLSRGHAARSAEQWLYLPSMGRERRLAEPDRGTRFAGTDFTFEDLQDLDPALYQVTSLPDVLVEDEPAARLRLVPLGRSAYIDEVLTVRRSDLVLLSRENRRRGDTTPSKELRLSSFTEINGRVAARRAEMIDRARGSRTVINLSDIRFDHPQPADRFTIQNLPRAASR